MLLFGVYYLCFAVCLGVVDDCGFVCLVFGLFLCLCCLYVVLLGCFVWFGVSWWFLVCVWVDCFFGCCCCLVSFGLLVCLLFVLLMLISVTFA